jgi:transglutaminase-like putative cysteine protease
MKFKITHSTAYVFDSEVFLEPHYLRFRPKRTPYAEIVSHELEILPNPIGHRTACDEENNLVDLCWFEGMTEKLTLKAISIIETIPYNPFDFIIQPEQFNKLPFQYNKDQQNVLMASLENEPISKDLLEYGDSIMKASHFNTLQYLSKLTNQLHQDFTVEYREEGSPLPPNDTFKSKKGSCRDLTWMQINLLRHQGLAARFVSGYFYFDMEEPSFELHAWVDVFLPGAGWVGLDPSHGILTGNTHFPIATSAHFGSTMPVSGDIRGSATSKLITELYIDKV